MKYEKIFSSLILFFLKIFLSLKESNSLDLGNPKKILIIRQHNQLGDMFAGVSLFKAVKQKYPEANVTLIASPQNFAAVQNKFISKLFVFDKSKLFQFNYLKKLYQILRTDYDVVIVPVTVSISLTSNLLARFSKSKIRIGPASLDGKVNDSAFLFDRRINLDWRKYHDCHIAERILDIVRPFGISTDDFRSELTLDRNDELIANNFISKINRDGKAYLVGLHVGAGKPQNKWALINYVTLIGLLQKKYKANFYLTGTDTDRDEINFILANSPIKIHTFLNKRITAVASLISKSDLFIGNDTGVMHAAGTTETPQISIFGPTNPLNWAPIGINKFFLRKSELIDDVHPADVFQLCKSILDNQKK